MNTQFNKKHIIIAFIALFFLHWGCSPPLSQSVKVSSGAVNGVVIDRNGKKLVVYGGQNEEIKEAEWVLFTHFRRDVIQAGRYLVKKGAHAVAPAEEAVYFTGTDSIWTEFTQTRYLDYQNQTTKIGISPVEISRFVKGGETLKWQDLDIKVLNTPGYTRGSVSYIMDIDGKKFAFTGDLIYDDGKILDLYSFQDTLANIMGYHGYAARLGQLVSSLQKIAGEKPDYIIPVRGPVITEPSSSIQKLIQRIRSVYRNFLSIAAYQWYYPEGTEKLKEHVLGPSGAVERMPHASVIQDNLPSWCMNFNIAWLVFAEDSSAFLMDCGNKMVLEKLKKMKQTGRLKSLDGVFITHYHDDHVTYINEVVKEFDCPVYAIQELKDILVNPSAYRMPAQIDKPVKNLIAIKNGEKMSWKDYALTFCYFPGQTLYHGALLFEKYTGESLFFIGDSFSPSGIDDYCLLNRNFLHPETGYFYCLDILKKLPEKVLLANQHIGSLFSFSRQQLESMTEVLYERTDLLEDLFPWENINYGIDEQWIQFYPYGQKAAPGETVDVSVKIFNHSDVPETFIMKPNVPEGFKVKPRDASLVLEPRQEGEKKFKIKISDSIAPGVSVLTLDVQFNNWDLREWSEGLIEISRKSL